MNYTLLALDIDGTLTNSKKEITLTTKEAIKQLQNSGADIILASGRPTYGVLPVAKEIGLDTHGGYILSFNGGRIENAKTNEVIYQQTIPSHMIPLLFDFAIQHHVTMLSYEDNTIITTCAQDPYVQIEARINHMQVRQIEHLADYICFPVNKCMLVGDGDRMEQLESLAVQQMGKELNIYRSEPYFLEIMPQNIDKANSLAHLLQHLGRSRDELAACGDGYNDISMIQYAGLGVAMANAQQEVKQVSNHITGSNDQDGVAQVIKQFFLQ